MKGNVWETLKRYMGEGKIFIPKQVEREESYSDRAVCLRYAFGILKRRRGSRGNA